jgi:hypothetical protein
MDRREFLAAAVVAATAGAAETSPTTPSPPAHCTSDSIEELSLADIADAFADGRLTSQQLTKDSSSWAQDSRRLRARGRRRAF